MSKTKPKPKRLDAGQFRDLRAALKEEEARRVESLLSTPCASEDFKEGVRRAAAKIRSERSVTPLDAAKARGA